MRTPLAENKNERQIQNLRVVKTLELLGIPEENFFGLLKSDLLFNTAVTFII